MIENIPFNIVFGFILITITTVWFFGIATKNWRANAILMCWIIITAILGYTGFYRNFEAMPPRFIFLLPLGLIFVVFYSFTPNGKRFIYNADIKWLTLIHIVRVPIEIVLYYLFLEDLIPDLMTFKGYNYDILSGISAPIIFILFFVQRKINKNVLLIWNIICLALLVNILTIALLSAKTPFQILAFYQPNVGVTYFPFVWLPAVIVPIILFSHIASIKQILLKTRSVKDWTSKLKNASKQYKILFRNLSIKQLNYKTSPNSWSIAQNMEHIILLNESYYSIFEALKSGNYKAPFLSRISFISFLIGKKIIKSVQPDHKINTKTFSIVQPSQYQSDYNILNKFEKHNLELVKQIEDLKDFINKGIIISSPFNKSIIYKLETALDVIIAHELRHLNQSNEVYEKIKEKMDI